ncbi:hypothetical protein BDQ12DRAFT_723310 [Crucibulum laeve]|uniref:Uncharacterized protein n=1 Tax=Crucibulum laeve TaxID=68775 RepID=A0A5C3M0E4_9AGAR|nr:hypothetical protein BDQ12DRAFT_723310 [Crucibulum laeve]
MKLPEGIIDPPSAEFIASLPTTKEGLMDLMFELLLPLRQMSEHYLVTYDIPAELVTLEEGKDFVEDGTPRPARSAFRSFCQNIISVLPTDIESTPAAQFHVMGNLLKEVKHHPFMIVECINPGAPTPPEPLVMSVASSGGVKRQIVPQEIVHGGNILVDNEKGFAFEADFMPDVSSILHHYGFQDPFKVTFTPDDRAIKPETVNCSLDKAYLNGKYLTGIALPDLKEYPTLPKSIPKKRKHRKVPHVDSPEDVVYFVRQHMACNPDLELAIIEEYEAEKRRSHWSQSKYAEEPVAMDITADVAESIGVHYRTDAPLSNTASTENIASTGNTTPTEDISTPSTATVSLPPIISLSTQQSTSTSVTGPPISNSGLATSNVLKRSDAFIDFKTYRPTMRDKADLQRLSWPIVTRNTAPPCSLSGVAPSSLTHSTRDTPQQELVQSSTQRNARLAAADGAASSAEDHANVTSSTDQMDVNIVQSSAMLRGEVPAVSLRNLRRSATTRLTRQTDAIVVDRPEPRVTRSRTSNITDSAREHPTPTTKSVVSNAGKKRARDDDDEPDTRPGTRLRVQATPEASTSGAAQVPQRVTRSKGVKSLLKAVADGLKGKKRY